MKLNDPFGRVGRRRDHAYMGFREQMRRRGVDDASAASAVARGMNRLAAQIILVLAAATISLSLLFPPYRGGLLVIAILLLIWVGSSHFQARLHLRRYISEELRQTEPDDTPREER